MKRKLLGVCGLAVTILMVGSACSSGGGSGGTSEAAGNGSNTGSATSGSSASASEGGSGSASCPGADKTLHVAFVYSTTSQDPFQEMADGAKMAAKVDGNTKIQLLAPPEVSASKEVQMLESAIHTAEDGIAWESVTPNAFVHPLQSVKEAGIPLVAVDNMTPEGVKPDLLVSNSNFQVGVKLGKAFVAQNPDPNGTVVLGNDVPTLGVLQQRLKGLQHVIKTKLPNMKIIGPFNAKSNQGLAANTQAWQAQVNAHPDATAFIGVGGPDGISLPLIKKKTGGDWLAGSADIPVKALQAVKDGRLFALSSPEHFMKGYIAIHEIIEQNRTCKPMPHGWWDSGSLLINKKNVDQIIPRQKNAQTRLAWFKKHEIPQQLANPPMKPFSELN